MIKYHIEITNGAEKELFKYNAKLQDRLINKIRGLASNPRFFGSKKLLSSTNYRIRVGDYRIIYSIDDAKKIIKILDIGHRKDIYR
ncbi:MAG: RelE/StbE family addiction module toxin [Candidatus Saganbacteria bacterium]|uniref:RelE/StbE family addiction module toxin n=1 Tax=Candidatus Saganbacteria bacterium TaxID=2575572 RepID=A0A833L3J1_UNCSA|nr:MAG: RelE/StbE family addiction module toxin [Candidatus Saganbacteria bacterium]